MKWKAKQGRERLAHRRCANVFSKPITVQRSGSVSVRYPTCGHCKLGVASLRAPSRFLENKETVLCRRLLMEERISFKKDIFYFPICFFSQYSVGSHQVLQHSAG